MLSTSNMSPISAKDSHSLAKPVAELQASTATTSTIAARGTARLLNLLVPCSEHAAVSSWAFRKVSVVDEDTKFILLNLIVLEGNTGRGYAYQFECYVCSAFRWKEWVSYL